MVGTFFITTSWIGDAGWLTQANLQTIAADGNEIGGHTVTHPDLTTLSAAAATAEVCDGRTTLTGWGFNVTDFAYPFAAENSAVETIVKNCGFASARGLGDIVSPASCASCPFAETIPPANPYNTAAPDEVDSTWTLKNLQDSVTNAENHGGGWVQLTFHHIAVGTDPTLTISPTLFSQFVTWLAARTANGTTVVRTVAQALGNSQSAPPPVNQVPVPAFTSAAANLAATFDGSGSSDPGGTVASYSWDFGDGSAAVGVAPAHTYAAAGTFQVKLTVTDNLGATGSVTHPVAVASAASPPTPGPSSTRFSGADRYATAVATSLAYYLPGVARVYVATGLNYPDALSAAPAAAHFASPLLLTTPGALPANVRAEIVRLNPAQIVVVGGSSVVSDAVFADLTTIKPTVRLSGPDRYATSRAIATDAFGTNAPTAYLATGENFPDALSASPAAAHFAGPLLLVPGTAALPDAATTAELTALHTTTVKIAGGASVVSTGIETALRLPGITVQRNSGADRYATAAAINLDAFASSDTVFLAVGTNFPDALVGAAVAGWKNSALYLTGTTCLDANAVAGIARLGATKLSLLGGTSVLSDAVMSRQACV